jgi:hypothetical protein
MSDGPKMLAALSTKKAVTDHIRSARPFCFGPMAWQHRSATALPAAPFAGTTS